MQQWRVQIASQRAATRSDVTVRARRAASGSFSRDRDLQYRVIGQLPGSPRVFKLVASIVACAERPWPAVKETEGDGGGSNSGLAGGWTIMVKAWRESSGPPCALITGCAVRYVAFWFCSQYPAPRVDRLFSSGKEIERGRERERENQGWDYCSPQLLPAGRQRRSLAGYCNASSDTPCSYRRLIRGSLQLNMRGHGVFRLGIFIRRSLNVMGLWSV